jgi:hypothetical protein
MINIKSQISIMIIEIYSNSILTLFDKISNNFPPSTKGAGMPFINSNQKLITEIICKYEFI